MNYEELIAAAQAYADRNDLEVKESMETFILMAEARINRVLKTRKQSTSTYTPTVTDQEFYSLPPDYAGMRDIQLNSDLPDGPHKSASFTMLTPELFNIQRNKPFTGKKLLFHYWKPNSNLSSSKSWPDNTNSVLPKSTSSIKC